MKLTIEDTVSCHSWALVCFLDHHAGVASLMGPLITTLLTILVASTGWWYAIFKARSLDGRLKKFLFEAGSRALDGARPIMQKTAAEKNVFQAELEKLDSYLADLSLMVEGVTMDKWPTQASYVTCRSLRDRILNLRAWVQLDGKHRDEFWPRGRRYSEEIETAWNAFKDQLR